MVMEKSGYLSPPPAPRNPLGGWSLAPGDPADRIRDKTAILNADLLLFLLTRSR